MLSSGVRVSGMCAGRRSRETWSMRLHRNLVSNGEGKVGHDACLAGTVVAELGELYGGMVASGDADLSEGGAVERRQDECAHVSRVKEAGVSGGAVFDVDVDEPVGGRGGEDVVGGGARELWVER